MTMSAMIAGGITAKIELLRLRNHTMKWESYNLLQNSPEAVPAQAQFIYLSFRFTVQAAGDL